MISEEPGFIFFNRIQPLTPSDWEAAVHTLQYPTFKPGQQIFGVGSLDKHIYFVSSGIGRYYYIDKNGKELNKSLVRQGGGFGSLSTCLDDEPSPYSAEALTELHTVRVHYNDLIKLSENHLNWSIIFRRILERLIIKKEKRERSFLELSAKGRYEQFLADFGSDADLIQLKQVAMFLGISDVSLSRLRREMNLIKK